MVSTFSSAMLAHCMDTPFRPILPIPSIIIVVNLLKTIFLDTHIKGVPSPRSLHGVQRPRNTTHRASLSHGSSHSRARSMVGSVSSSVNHTPHPSASSQSTSRIAPPAPSQEKTIKDLSSLFDFSQPYTLARTKPSSQSGGVAKRMLRRSKTDTSVNLTSPDDQVPSTPRKSTSIKMEGTIDSDYPRTRVGSTPSTPSKTASFEDTTLIRPPVAGASSNVRTYGGKSRSFLVSLGPAGDPIGDDLLGNNGEDDFTIRASYNELRERWGVDNSEDDPYLDPPISTSPGDKSKRKGKSKQLDTPTVHLPNGMMNDLKSITELRSKGESRRFLDDVGYLFEGLEPSAALSVRRGRLVRTLLALTHTHP